MLVSDEPGAHVSESHAVFLSAAGIDVWFDQSELRGALASASFLSSQLTCQFQYNALFHKLLFKSKI